jgi:hypothetical protein
VAAAQRGHSIPEAPHTTAAGHRGMARLPRKQNHGLPYVDPSTEYARTLRHLQALDARWRAEKTEHSRTHLGRREWAAQQGAIFPLAASPRPRSPERRGRPNASASLTERAAATHRKHGLDS